MNIPTVAKNAFLKAQQSSIVAPLFNMFMGRCTFFAIVFTVCGLILAFKGKLDANYSIFVTAIQGLLVVHSWKSDINDQRQAQQQMQSVNVINEIAPTPPTP